MHDLVRCLSVAGQIGAIAQYRQASQKSGQTSSIFIDRIDLVRGTFFISCLFLVQIFLNSVQGQLTGACGALHCSVSYCGTRLSNMVPNIATNIVPNSSLDKDKNMTGAE